MVVKILAVGLLAITNSIATFGDFDLIFGAAKHNLKLVDLPVCYGSRNYGETNISRWRHGLLLLKMLVFAAKRLKFR